MQLSNIVRGPVGNPILVGIALAIASLYLEVAVFSNCPASAQHHSVPAHKPAARPAANNQAALNRAMEGYLSRLRVRLTNNWTVPDGKNVVVLEAVVDPAGATTDVSTARSKADSVALDSATIAFEKSHPLEHFPAGSNAPGKLVITFTSTADPHGDSNSSIGLRIDPIPQAKGAAPQTSNAQPQSQPQETAAPQQAQETASPQSQETLAPQTQSQEMAPAQSQPQETAAPPSGAAPQTQTQESSAPQSGGATQTQP